MIETAELQTQMMLAYGTMFALGIVMDLAYFAVALTTVREASREASTLLVVGAVIHIVGALASPVVTYFGARMGGAEDVMRLTMISTIVFGLVGLAASSLQLVGIVRLAQRRPSS
jgi:hypothetical protein